MVLEKNFRDYIEKHKNYVRNNKKRYFGLFEYNFFEAIKLCFISLFQLIYFITGFFFMICIFIIFSFFIVGGAIYFFTQEVIEKYKDTYKK